MIKRRRILIIDLLNGQETDERILMGSSNPEQDWAPKLGLTFITLQALSAFQLANGSETSQLTE